MPHDVDAPHVDAPHDVDMAQMPPPPARPIGRPFLEIFPNG